MVQDPGPAGDAVFERFLSIATANPFWDDLKFVQEDHIVTFEIEMTFGSPSGQLAFLEVVVDARLS